MTSFSQIAKDKAKKLSKFRKSFKDVKATAKVAPKSTKSGTAAGGGAVSALSVAAVSDRVTTAEGNIASLDAAVNTKSDSSHEHIGTYLTEAEVLTLISENIGTIVTSAPVEPDPPTTDPATNPDDPTISPNQYGADFTYTQEWSDDFNDTDDTTLFNRWHPQVMTDGLHQAGNSGESGWRWSAYYGQPEECAFIYENSLHMRAYVEDIANPLRKAYTYLGTPLDPQDVRINLAFLSTWSRIYSGGQITDPDAPNRTWGPGTCFEFKVDYSEMKTQACRLSFWMMPAYENDSIAYSPDGTRGVEVDAPEIDFLDTYEDYAQSKVISGIAAGNTPSGSINLGGVVQGIDLTKNVHTFTLLWMKDRIVWYVDGIEYKRETDPRRIPQTPHYWIISREANSGVRYSDDGTHPFTDGTPELPADVGIWGVPVYIELDNLYDDTAKVLSFTSFSFTDTSTAGVGIGDDTSGISPTFTSSDPPTVWVDDTPGPATTHTFGWQKNGRTVSDWYLEVGSTRGGAELGSAQLDGATLSYELAPNTTYSGPVNARLWFREDEDSVWHWRDFGFSSGLQAYKTGTDANISVTTPVGSYTPSLPTVAGEGYVGPGDGGDGVFAATIDYSGGAKPAAYKADDIGLGITTSGNDVTLPGNGDYWQIQDMADLAGEIWQGTSPAPDGFMINLASADYKFNNLTTGQSIENITIPVV